MAYNIQELKDNLFNLNIVIADLKRKKDIAAFVEDNSQELEQLYAATTTFGAIYKQRLLKAKGSKGIEELNIKVAENTIFELTQNLASGAAFNQELLDNLYIILKDFVELYNSLAPDVEAEISREAQN